MSKKTFKIIALTFGAAIITTTIATPIVALSKNNSNNKNLDNISKQVYVDEITSSTNEPSSLTVKPNLNSNTVQDNSVVNDLSKVNNLNISQENVDSSKVKDCDDRSAISLDQFLGLNCRIAWYSQNYNNFTVDLQGINGASFNTGYRNDDLYNTNLRLCRVNIPYIIVRNKDLNGKLTNKVHVEYIAKRAKIEYLDDLKLINDCKDIEQKFDYFDGVGYCYNLYNKANYRTISQSSNELLFSIDLKEVHNPDPEDMYYRDQNGTWYHKWVYWTSGYIVMPRTWDDSIYKLANSRSSVDFKKLIEDGVKNSLFSINKQNRSSYSPCFLDFYIDYNDGNEYNDPIHHWNKEWNQIIENKFQNS